MNRPGIGCVKIIRNVRISTGTTATSLSDTFLNDRQGSVVESVMPQVNLRIQFEVPRGYSLLGINGGLCRNINWEFHKNCYLKTAC